MQKSAFTLSSLTLLVHRQKGRLVCNEPAEAVPKRLSRGPSSLPWSNCWESGPVEQKGTVINIAVLSAVIQR